MSTSRLRLAVALAATGVTSTAACSLLVSVDGLAGRDAVDASNAADATLPQDASPRDAAADSAPFDAAPADGAPDASADATTTVWTLLPNELPMTAADPSPAPLEIGVRFTVSSPGDVVAIRFYRTVTNPSGYVVHLWAASGVLLATVDVGSDVGQAIGWREQAITPVHLTPSNVYIASYFSNNGACSFTEHGFASPLTRGPLTAPASGDSGTDGNGVFEYVSNPLTVAPARSFDETNYFVDVKFRTP